MKKIVLILFLVVLKVTVAQDNYAKIDLYESDNFEELDEFFGDTLLDDYTVYFTGENHQFAKVNSELEYKILTYLHERQNVKHFLFEQSPAVGFIMTEIIVNKNTEFKYFLKDKYYKPFYDLIIDLKRFNSDLDSTDKIRVHGIDVERFPLFSIFALNSIIDTLSQEGETGLMYEAIQSLNSSEFRDGTPDQIYNGGGTRVNLMGDAIDAWSTFETIIEESDRLKDTLKNELGDNYNIFMEILEGVEKGHAWYNAERNGDLSAPSIRERFMLKQFKQVYKENPDSKFYGQFGRCHLHAKKEAKRCYSHDMESIAGRINKQKDSTLNGKVLTIPVYYDKAQNFDGKIIQSLNLDYRFDRDDEIYLIDMDYMDGDNPLVGFGEELPFVIVNTYFESGAENVYDFNYTLDEYHLGVLYGFHYFNKLGDLNNNLVLVGENGFTNKFETRTIAFDYIAMNNQSVHLSYSFMPPVSNGGRFNMKGRSFTFGQNYAFGNKYIMAAVGLNFTYGQMYLIEQNDGTPNLIQSNLQNVTVYKNDVFSLDPNLDLRLTLPIISLNARVGYARDISGKYWRLDGKMKDFAKTAFHSPYIQVGLSLNFKDEY